MSNVTLSLTSRLALAVLFPCFVTSGPAWAGAQEWLATLPLSTVDQTIGIRLEGTVANEHVGASVDLVPDVNGDRLDDVLIGAPGIQGGASGAGGGYVAFGRAAKYAASPFSLLSLTGTNGGRYVGNQANGGNDDSHFVRGVGDVNGDGRNDFAISAPRAEPANGSYQGTAYIIFGKASANWQVTDSLGSLNGSNGFRFNGAGYTGTAVAGPIDFNGDGFKDIVVGGPYAGGDVCLGGDGCVYVIYGTGSFPALLKEADLAGSKGFVIRAPSDASAAPAATGSAVDNAGDLNGDGLSDLVIGAPSLDLPNNVSDAGEAYVVFGTKSKPTGLDLSALNGSNGFRITSLGLQSFTGMEVSGVGDVNGDGYRDVAITANGSSDKGNVFVLFGSATGFPATVNLSNLGSVNALQIVGGNGDLIGDVVDAAGDINADGFSDIIVGAPRATSGSTANAGASFVIFGRPSFTPSLVDLTLLDGANGFAITNAAVDDGAGYVAGGADVNGDGFSDFAIGAPRFDVGANTDAGATYVVFGRPPLGPVDRSGSAASQYISGGADDDTLRGLFGNDRLEGRGGGDRQEGGNGSDTASYAHAGKGVIANLAAPGGNTNDAAGDTYFSIENLEGSAFNDTLSGNGGPNSLKGGLGRDILNGAFGSDLFVYGSVAESPRGTNRDQIIGFNAGSSATFVDRLDLRAVDAKTTIAGNQAFTFIGTKPFGRHAGELRLFPTAAGLIAAGDVNGDAVADIEILLKGLTQTTPFSAKDFLL